MSKEVFLPENTLKTGHNIFVLRRTIPVQRLAADSMPARCTKFHLLEA
jgi:hypothetical protein